MRGSGRAQAHRDAEQVRPLQDAGAVKPGADRARGKGVRDVGEAGHAHPAGTRVDREQHVRHRGLGGLRVQVEAAGRVLTIVQAGDDS